MKMVLVAVMVALTVPVALCAAEPESGENDRHLFILTGQSNMRKPLPDTFEDAVIRVFGQKKVMVVTRSVPSQPIKAWDKNWVPPEGVEVPAAKGSARPNGWLYEQLIGAVQKKTAGQSLASVTFVWMQGEADANAGWAKAYEKSFFRVLAQIKEDLGVAQINFVIGRINDHWLPGNKIVDGEAIRTLQVRMAEARENGDWVDTDDLNTGMNPWAIYEVDGGHFPTPGYRVMGRRFARKACQLIDPELKLDDRHFDEVFFDRAEDVASHLAIGRKIGGTTHDHGREGGAPGLESLLDGKYGVANHEAPEWIGFSPSQETVELVVDLGKKQDVTGIGVNILVSKKAEARFPRQMLVSTSENGTDYHKLGKKAFQFFYRQDVRARMHNTLPPQSFLVFVEPVPVSARLIKIELATDDAWLFLDEIVVNPVARK